VGDVITRALIQGESHPTSLRIKEIALYGTLVDEVTAGMSAQVVVSGEGGELLRRDALLYLL